MNSAELAANRQATKAFIHGDPVSLVLRRSEETKLDDGGRKRGPEETIDAQTFRLIPQGDVTQSIMTPDGVQRTPTYVLLGEYDSDMALWDKFSLNGHDYQIVNPPRLVPMANPYEKKGDVALL